MPLPTTVVDEETATTYVAMPCPHCEGDGVQFVTVEEVAATLATTTRLIATMAIDRTLDHLGRRYARELATFAPAAPVS